MPQAILLLLLTIVRSIPDTPAVSAAVSTECNAKSCLVVLSVAVPPVILAVCVAVRACVSTVCLHGTSLTTQPPEQQVQTNRTYSRNTSSKVGRYRRCLLICVLVKQAAVADLKGVQRAQNAKGFKI